MVNMMTIDEDRCFQCQEHGHIAGNCPNIRCLNVMTMVTLSWIANIGFFLQEPQQSVTNQSSTKVTTPDQVPDITMRTGTGKAIQGLSHNFTDIIAQVIMIPIEAVLDHNIGIISIITGVAHDAPIPHT